MLRHRSTTPIPSGFLLNGIPPYTAVSGSLPFLATLACKVVPVGVTRRYFLNITLTRLLYLLASVFKSEVCNIQRICVILLLTLADIQ